MHLLGNYIFCFRFLSTRLASFRLPCSKINRTAVLPCGGRAEHIIRLRVLSLPLSGPSVSEMSAFYEAYKGAPSCVKLIISHYRTQRNMQLGSCARHRSYVINKLGQLYNGFMLITSHDRHIIASARFCR